MTLEILAVEAGRAFLRAYFKALPLWGKVLVAITASLITILLLGIVIAVIWIIYSFISSGILSSLPPQVAASIVAGLFTVIYSGPQKLDRCLSSELLKK